ncbi:MAG: Calx-beta domain-containing protein, partial [Candidatus Binatia bacterium]
LTLSAPVGATLGDANAIGSILDDDAPPALTIEDASVAEGDAGTVDLYFPVTLSAASATTTQVHYSTSPGTAESGVDYLAFDGLLSIPAGSTAGAVRIEVIGDLESELDETFTVDLADPVEATLANLQGIGTIIDDDMAQISIADVLVVEGNSGTSTAKFEITLAEPATTAVSFDFATVQETATEDLDFTAKSGQVVVPEGASTAAIEIEIIGDTWFEEDERLLVRLTNPVGAELVDGEATGTIRNDDGCSSANFVANGGAERFDRNLLLSSWTAVVGEWRPRFGNPLAAVEQAYFDAPDNPFAELAQTVSLAPFASRFHGGNAALVAVGAVRWAGAGGEAALWVELYDGGGALLANELVGRATTDASWQFLELEIPVPAEASTARVRLVGDGYFDGVGLRVVDAPTLAVLDTSGYEPDTGTAPMTFRVVLSCAVEPKVRVTLATTDGTAVAGADYLPVSTEVTIPRGAVEATVPVAVVGDRIDEAHETMFLDIVGAPSTSRVLLLDARGVGTIVDGDFCRRSQGYWGAHAELWPADFVVIGGVILDRAQIQAFLDYNGSEASARLARHLVAAKLNLLEGSAPFVVPTVEQSDAFLRIYPPFSDPQGAARDEANGLKEVLEKYNKTDCKEL